MVSKYLLHLKMHHYNYSRRSGRGGAILGAKLLHHMTLLDGVHEHCIRLFQVSSSNPMGCCMRAQSASDTRTS